MDLNRRWLDNTEEAMVRSSVAAYGKCVIAAGQQVNAKTSLQGKYWQQRIANGLICARVFPMCHCASNDGGGENSAAHQRELGAYYSRERSSPPALLFAPHQG